MLTGPFLVVCLGNPGEKYKKNRHNAGFLFLEHALSHSLFQVTSTRVHPLYDLYRIEKPFQAFFLKPRTFMNLSGTAVAAFLEDQPIPIDRMAVVYDDMALPLGRLKWRPEGTSGGQKGMGNILDVLSTKSVARLRLGIGSPSAGDSAVDFVLSDFSSEECKVFEKLLCMAADSLVCWAELGISVVMSRFNGLNLSDPNKEKVEE